MLPKNHEHTCARNGLSFVMISQYSPHEPFAHPPEASRTSLHEPSNIIIYFRYRNEDTAKEQIKLLIIHCTSAKSLEDASQFQDSEMRETARKISSRGF
jgi:hypothetical protein